MRRGAKGNQQQKPQAPRAASRGINRPYSIVQGRKRKLAAKAASAPRGGQIDKISATRSIRLASWKRFAIIECGSLEVKLPNLHGWQIHAKRERVKEFVNSFTTTCLC